MKIIFNLHNVGLGNNGGSRTLIRCGETLASMGHKVIMYSNIKSQYTWHSPKGIFFQTSLSSPSCDIAIATGIESVYNTVNSKAKVKAYYIRGYESWKATDKQLLSSYKKLRCIVNSEWIYKLLKDKNIVSDIVYPGLDFEWYKTSEDAFQRDIVGGLYHKKHKTKRHKDVIEASRISGFDCEMMNKDIINPSPKKQRRWYNSMKVWMAPTQLEGLHNPPMEASLCGCAVICSDHPRNGMSDFAIHNETALVYKDGDINQASSYIKELMANDGLRKNLNANMIKLLNNKIGSREKNMNKLMDILWQ